MKAIIVQPDSKQPVLLWQAVSDISFEPAEVLVAVRATAVNRADLLQARGQYPPPAGVSEILGLEMSGAVAAVGAEVENRHIGDRVLALLPGAAMQSMLPCTMSCCWICRKAGPGRGVRRCRRCG